MTMTSPGAGGAGRLLMGKFGPGPESSDLPAIPRPMGLALIRFCGVTTCEKHHLAGIFVGVLVFPLAGKIVGVLVFRSAASATS